MGNSAKELSQQWPPQSAVIFKGGLGESLAVVVGYKDGAVRIFTLGPLWQVHTELTAPPDRLRPATRVEWRQGFRAVGELRDGH